MVPRYHLHLVSCDQPIIDFDGIEADGDHDVCAGALEVISEVRADPEQYAKWRDWHIEIVEDTGRIVVTIPFAPLTH